jgi:putative lipoprotein
VLSEQSIEAAGRNVPIPYRLRFDPDRIESRHRYVVGAKIFQEDRMIWTSMTAHPVMPLENPTDLEITVERVRR